MLRFYTRLTGPPGGWRYTDPSTLYPAKHESFGGLMGKVAEHRLAHGMILEEGWREAVEDEMCLQLGDKGKCFDPGSPKPFQSALERTGRKLWKQLHERANALPLQLTEHDRERLKTWLVEWENAIPNFSGCACRDHWYEAKAKRPPTFETGDGFRSWAIEIHSDISERIGKARFAFSRAA